jgi:hypothetical protein
MAAITSPPTPSSLTVNSGPFTSPNISPHMRLAIYVQCLIVLLNYKGGTNYIGNHSQLTIDCDAAFKGMTPEAWAMGLGQTDFEVDPGAQIVSQYWQQANYRDSVNMPATLALITPLLLLQQARTTRELAKQAWYLRLEIDALAL